jgi:hypothetical protein
MSKEADKAERSAEVQAAINARMSKVRAGKKPKAVKAEAPADTLKKENDFLRGELDLIEGGDLSKAERRQIEEEIRREVRAKQRKDKKEELRKTLRKRIEQEAGVREGDEEIYIDLAKHSACIMLDGVQYSHGQVYRVRAAVAAQMREIMQNGHYHQAEIDGHPKRYYQRRPGKLIAPEGVTTRSSLLEV